MSHIYVIVQKNYIEGGNDKLGKFSIRSSFHKSGRINV